jgi:DNA-binding NarL/FixJ family response regulator
MKARAEKPKQCKRSVFLVEDHPVTREGFAQLINYQSDLKVCGQTGAPSKAIPLIGSLKPDLAIVDISLAESNGLELIKDLKARHPRVPVLVLSTHDESLYAERALRAGARGYVMKQAPTCEVMQAIRLVLQGGLYLSESMRTQLVHKHFGGPHVNGACDIDVLSDRELQVFELIGRGNSTRQVASKLHLSISTVETHRAHVKQKLRLASGLHLVRRAVEWVSSRGC